jgi:hypothetical protein
MTKWLCTVALASGCVAPPPEPVSGGFRDCWFLTGLNCYPDDMTPEPTGPSVVGEMLDDTARAPAAVDGTYHLTYPYTASPVTVRSLSSWFTARLIPGAIEVIATNSGVGLIDVSNGVSTVVSIEAAAVSNVVAAAPHYQPLAHRPTQYLGPDFTGAVRLLDQDGRSLVDRSISLAGDWFTPDGDTFTSHVKTGAQTLTVTASSLHGSLALEVSIVDSIDDIVMVETDETTSIHVHRVCAHAMRAGAEVFATFQLTVDGGAVRDGPYTNCAELPFSASAVTVIARAGGLTRQLVAHRG